jgi:RimJ/RimL family protein N-acetyltransferase
MESTVYFRAFEDEDSELIYQWMNDDKLKQMSIGLNRRMCKDEALEWVKARMHHHDYNVFWAICTKDTNKMIGYTCLTNIHYINRSAVFGGLVIGDKDYQDGMAWIESYLFVYEYGFERLNLNRIEGTVLIDHKASKTIGDVMFSKGEGVLRQAAYKNGKFYDVGIGALLREDYFLHKENGDYEISAVLKRLTKKIRENKKAEKNI